MKKILLLFVVVVMGMAVYADDSVYGDKEDLTESQKYALKKPATRASGMGQSMRENVARQKAMDNARSALSQALEMAILNASKTLSYDLDGYASSDEDGETMYEGGSKTRSITKTISQNVLKGTPIVKEDKFYNKKNRRFTVFVCVEYQGTESGLAEEAVKQLKNRMSDKDRSRIENELGKWQEEIEKELSGGDSNSVPDLEDNEQSEEA